MNANDILNALDIGEDTDWEFKSARGGTPHSLWETYSAMANTNGGTIVLGIGQHGDTFTVDGLENVRKTKRVSNARMRQLSGEHPSDLTRLLQGLVGKRFLCQVGQKRGARYRLPGPAGVGVEGDSLHKADSLRNGSEDSLHRPKDLSESEKAKLWAIVAPALLSPRLAPEQTRSIIRQLCDGTFFTAAELGVLMSRNPDSLRNRFLTPMVEEELLIRKFPAEPNRPDQAYTAKRQEAPQRPQDTHGP